MSYCMLTARWFQESTTKALVRVQCSNQETKNPDCVVDEKGRHSLANTIPKPVQPKKEPGAAMCKFGATTKESKSVKLFCSRDHRCLEIENAVQKDAAYTESECTQTITSEGTCVSVLPACAFCAFHAGLCELTLASVLRAGWSSAVSTRQRELVFLNSSRRSRAISFVRGSAICFQVGTHRRRMT